MTLFFNARMAAEDLPELLTSQYRLMKNKLLSIFNFLQESNI